MTPKETNSLLVVFLYTLARDDVVTGRLEAIYKEVTENRPKPGEYILSNGGLGEWAERKDKP